MPTTATAQSGSLKLRGLLRNSRELLRRRQLKKAIYSAQIAQDFAERSGEAPQIAVAARLLMAEAYVLNAAYTHDDALRSRGWRLLEQVESDGARGAVTVDAVVLQHLRALCQRRLGNFEAAREAFTALAASTPESHPYYARILVHLLATHAQLPGGERHPPGEAIDRALVNVPTEERIELLATRALANAHFALRDDRLSAAIDEAHDARRLAARAGLPEVEAIATCFLGRLSRLRGNHQIALRLLYDAMDAAERMGYGPLVLETHLQIGRVFATLHNDREAAKYLRYVVEEARAVDDTAHVYEASLALGVATQHTGDLAEAGAHLNVALQAAVQLAWTHEQATALSELAALKLEEGQVGLAQHLADEALRRFEQAGQPACAKTRLTCARLAAEGSPEGDVAPVLALARSAEALAREADDRASLVGALRLRASLHASREEHAAAFAAEREAAELALALVRQQRERQLPDLDMRAALQQKEREIEELTRDKDLKDAIVAKNEEIERANRDLLQANEELRQFAFVASHDLKEPLRQIGSYIGLIRRRYTKPLDERGETFFGYVNEGVARLNRLLDSLMQYTTIARIEVTRERVELTGLLDGIRDELAGVIARQGASLSYGALPSVETSGELLRHVLFALVDNALKFSREGVPAEVRITAEETEGMVRIGVHDAGIGIREEYRDKVFTLFQMLHAKTEYSGTGVGLAIAQKTIQRLGGRVWFDSAGEGAGTSFYVTLPLAVERSVPEVGAVEVVAAVAGDVAEAA